MTYNTFYSHLHDDIKQLNSEDADYINYHARRFHITYKACVRFLKPNSKVLSVGAGFGSIEKVLALDSSIEITIVDFPETIEAYRSLYDRNNIKYISADLTADELNLPHDHYDLFLQSEVIEHLPIAPSIQILKFKPYIKKSGLFMVTTPNLGSILHIMLLLFMKPIMPEPEKMFSPVGIENQGVHRREYLPSEIQDAFTQAGFRNIHTSFFHYTFAKTLQLRVLYFIGRVIPRFRPGMLLVGQRVN